MMSRLPAALARGMLVALLVLFPSIALPAVSADTQLVALFVALCTWVFVSIEYIAQAPSLLEFRAAPPLNRIRFLGAATSIVIVTFMLRDPGTPTALSGIADALGTWLAAVTDIPFSPVRLMRQMAAPALPPEAVAAVTRAAAISYSCAALAVVTFLLAIARGAWPSMGRDFNLWVNLPTFDPIGQGDPVARLRRLSLFNLLLGILAPFLAPAIVAGATGSADLMQLAAPNSLIWIVTLWAFVPATLVMRGIALKQIASLLESQRRAAVLAADGDALSVA